MTDQNPEPINPLAQRWLKFLPMMMIGHLLVTIPTFVISIASALCFLRHQQRVTLG